MSGSVKGERTVSEVAGNKRPWLTKNHLAALMGAAAVGAIALVFYLNPGAPAPEVERAGAPKQISRVVPYEPSTPNTMPVTPAANALPAYEPAAPPENRRIEPEPMEKRAQDMFQAPTAAPAQLAKTGRMMSFSTSGAKSQGAGGGGAGGTSSGDEDRDGTRVAFKGTEIPGSKAGPAIDQTYVLMPGLIQCVLDTAIDTSISGDLLCHLPAPVISRGNVVLMEKDSMITGTYSGETKAGQKRILAASAVGYTPKGVPVPLGGNFADSLGRTGLDGQVDNHYMERFGAALGLSLTESLLSIVQASVSSSGNSYVNFSSGGGGPASLARDILRATADIQPTIRKNPGEMIALWIKQPIDFGPAYKLVDRASTQPRNR